MVNYNGDLLPAASHFLNHTNRGLRYGDALSETFKYNGSDLLFWEDHYFALMAAMRQFRMEIPMAFNMEFLEAEVRKTLEASTLANRPAALRITVFRKPGASLAPETLEIDYLLEAAPLDSQEYQISAAERRADIFRDYTLQANGLGALPLAACPVRVLGSIYAAENDLHTCLLLNERKEVCDTLDGNLFVRFGNHMVTPPADSGCHNGVLRRRILGLGRADASYTWEERPVSPFELQQADELFTSSALYGVRPITDYKKAKFSAEAAAHLTTLLNKAASETPAS